MINQSINWCNIKDQLDTQIQANAIMALLKKPPLLEDDVLQEIFKEFCEKFNDNDENTHNWKQKVPKWLYNFDTIFSKTKSE